MSAVGFEALRKTAVDVSRETFDILKKFESELRRWNGHINLVSQADMNELWTRHICDCAQLPGMKPDAARWLDLGSGGGLPGLVIAIMIRERSGARIDLVESNRKKASFLMHAAGHFSLPVRVHAKRITDVYGEIADPQIVTARALTALPHLLDLASKWLSRGATGLFQKGRDYQNEIEQSAARWHFDLVQHASKSDPDGVILELSGLKSADDR